MGKEKLSMYENAEEYKEVDPELVEAVRELEKLEAEG